VSVLDTIQALELISGGTVTFVVPGGPPFIFNVRVAQGFDRIRGICISPISVPPFVPGILMIQQSMDGVFWDHTDSFPVVSGGPDVPFDIAVLARYVRVQFVAPVFTTMTIRIHGLLTIG